MSTTITSKKNIFSVEERRESSTISEDSYSTGEIIATKKNFKKLKNFKDVTTRTVGDLTIKRGRWSEEEDEVLLNLFPKFGMKWNELSIEMKTRNWKQIRDRWVNVLDPNLSKEPYSVEEDILIHDLHLTLENRWVDYMKYLPGRSADNIKNRFHSSVKGKESLIKVYKCVV